MLYRLTTALAVLASLMLPAAPALADPVGSCAVTPNPVPVGTSYTVDATGLSVNTAFVVHIQQVGGPGADVFATADAQGNATTGPLSGPTTPGATDATWKKLAAWRTGGGPIITYGPAEAICSWSVVA